MLSIVIINYKNAPLLKLCINSLRRIIPPAFRHEIIVVDIAANEETRYIATEKFSGIRYAPFAKNIGYTKGANEGLQMSAGDKVFIMNPDIIPLKGSLELLYAYMREHPEIGIAGPQLLNFDGSFQQSCFRFYTPLTIVCRRTFLGKLPFVRNILDRFLLKDKNLDRALPVDWLMGSALMVSRNGLVKAGYMDENLFLYMSDVDWPRRFWENGYNVVFYPQSIMYHYHRRESHGALNVLDAFFNRQTRQHIKDAIRYFYKNGIHEKSYV